MNTFHSLEQLEQLAKNKHYVMSEDQIKALESYRNENYKKRRKSSNQVVKHNTKFSKHSPELQEESHNGEQTR